MGRAVEKVENHVDKTDATADKSKILVISIDKTKHN